MTTMTMQPPRSISPAAGLRHSLTLAGRGMRKIVKNPEQLLDVSLQPILFLVMFTYLFGGAVQGDTGTYLLMLAPGLMVQNTIMASLSTGIGLNTDVNKGVFDRFRSMPIARSAPLIGAVMADALRCVVALVVLLVAATVMGFRIQTSPLAALAAMLLMVVFGLCFCWISVFVGMLVRSTQAVTGLLVAITLPLTFGSNVFVPSQTMPGWLRAWTDINPVSLLADAMRGLLVEGPVAAPLAGSAIWLVALVAVFFPLAMWAYRRRVG